MENDLGFKKGVIFGIVLVLLCNTLYKSVQVTYSRLIKKEISYEQKYKNISKLIDENFAKEYTLEGVQEGVFYGMVDSLDDRYSYYMNKEEYKGFMEDSKGIYTGLGIRIFLNSSEKMEVEKVFEESPAEKGGLKTGDIILKIDDVGINMETYASSLKKIRNSEDEEVQLTVYRPSTEKTFDTKIIKEDINVPTVSHKMIDRTTGYIRIIQFEQVTTEQFKIALKDLENNGMQELILDLRDNPGGLMNVVLEITDILVPKGYITYVEYKSGDKEYHYSKDDHLGKPLAILVNGGSASASEVLAGAVKDYKVGFLVGTTTFGKGVVQSIFGLTDGSGVKLTVAKYYTPSGECIDGTGIEPDFYIDFPDGFDYNDLNDENDIQLQKAVEVIKNKK